MTTHLRVLITGALVSVALVAGCAQAQPEGTVTPDPSSTSANPSATPPFVSASPDPKPGTTVTLTGRVEKAEIEGGCTILRTDANKVFELFGGDRTILTAGNRVTVTGKVRSDLASTCQMGPILEVHSSQLA